MSAINGISNVNKNNAISVNTEQKNKSAKGDFASYLGETKSMDQIFAEAAKKYNVSENLLKAIGKAESGYNANAVSRSGAQGVMQLMPATAEYLGVTDSFDAEQNIMGGAKYISELLNKYNGNTSLALAAYNAGMGNVSKYGGIPPFEETQNYVKKVTGYMNQGVSAGNVTVAVGNYSATLQSTAQIKSNLITGTSETETETTQADLIELFTYDDYLKFLETFFEDKEEEEKEDNSNYFGSKAISYNIPVNNLFK
ncbi:hypothetical protein acsn021_36520 [Anaerocolumna cellulosilytica]|uniref:Uncharacterized protein n=1 Tax=Anaerocolumna cellulosilytica TaxID=433286 RepID=A0A6S6QXZ9_9FIRM|nr:lytic transglycosylase domain-containing protein [Anaerocolumna cellulosilytica]MBB5195080.1 hypothetical protein [Anaerocolumna cellulosilytica]BCJ96083.1 hypothetical protein acsn021_36520 [Anaerocolumna cellulosilytica]